MGIDLGLYFVYLLFYINTSSSAITERVDQFWPKVEDDILQWVYLQPL